MKKFLLKFAYNLWVTVWSMVWSPVYISFILIDERLNSLMREILSEHLLSLQKMFLSNFPIKALNVDADKTGVL